jgi:hypothetical protein
LTEDYYRDIAFDLVLKKGLETAGIGSSFHFKKIPLSIEYTKLSLSSIPST